MFFKVLQTDGAHLLSVASTTWTDIAPVKYNLELTEERLLSFRSVSARWRRSKGITHQYPPQPLPAPFIIRRYSAVARNIAPRALFLQLNPVNKPNSCTHTDICLLNGTGIDSEIYH